MTLPRTRHGLLVLALAAALGTGAAPAGATPPGANGKIAFHAPRGGETAISVMNPDGSGEQRLTTGLHAFYPAWSPDGTKIAFSAHSGGPARIYVMNADGTGRTPLTSPTPPTADIDPGWAPDGSRIVFSRSAFDEDTNITHFDLWAMAADGSGEVPLTTGIASDSEPTFSPGGRAIAFTRSADTKGIWAMNADGSGQRQLTVGDGPASWSPDGTMIAFRRGTAIWVMNADGSGARQLTPGTVTDFQPAWSPDGRKIALRRGSGSGDGIWVMNADGSGAAALPGGADGQFPAWQTLPATCDDVRVGQAVAKGCFSETAAGSGVYETAEVAWVGGFEVHPREGGKLVLDTNQPAVSSAGAGAVIRFGSFVVPIAVEDLPVATSDATLRLGGTGSLPVLLDLPLKATAKVSWQSGGTAAAFEGELEIGELTRPLGQLVTLGPGESVANAGGKLKAQLVNGTGFVLDQAELAIGEINVIPAQLRVPRVLKLRNLLLRFERREGRPFWTGRGGITIPFAGRDLTITGTVFVFDGSPAGGGLEVDGLNWLIPDTPLFLQSVGGDLLLAPNFGLDLGIGATLGPRIGDAALMKIAGTAKGGSLATGCTRGSDPIQGTFDVEIAPLDALVGSGVASVALSGTSCIYVSRNPALEVGMTGRIAFLGGLLGYEGAQTGYVSRRGASLEGSATILLPELADVQGRTLLSTEGIAACGQFRFAQAGFGYRWGQSGLPTIFSGCDLGPFSVPAAASAAALTRIVRVPRGLPHAAFRVGSPAGAPPVRLEGPGGRRVSSPAGGGGLQGRDAVIVPAAHERATYVLVRRPAAGRWRVRSLDPAMAVARVALARGLPRPRVKARVRGTGSRRRLTYRVAPLRGQWVTFLERGGGITRVLGRAKGRRGRIAFAPARAARRGRRIVAEVTQNRLPRAQMTVARFKAPPLRRPARPRVKARRGKTRLVLSWPRSRGAARYLVVVRRGKATLHRVVTGRRRLVFRDMPSGGRLRVTVQGLSDTTRPGPPAKRTVKPRRG